MRFSISDGERTSVSRAFHHFEYSREAIDERDSHRLGEFVLVDPLTRINIFGAIRSEKEVQYVCIHFISSLIFNCDNFKYISRRRGNANIKREKPI